MKYHTSHKSILGLLIALLVAVSASAAINMQTVLVGDAGNPNDSTGYGAVNYQYRIGTYEVTNSQYAEFLNNVAKSDPHGLYSTGMATARGGITRTGSSGTYTYSVIDGRGNKPVMYVTFWNACRFTNWLTNGQGSGSTETGVYNLGGVSEPDNSSVTRNITAFNAGGYAIASENEWYKAAYYDPSASGPTDDYWLYATRSDTAPDSTAPNSTDPNSANFSGSGVNDVSDVGGYSLARSHYGTFDQSGNVEEWLDTIDSTERILRGGGWYFPDSTLSSDYSRNRIPTGGGDSTGFRITQGIIPEPATYALFLGFGAFVFIMIRHRRRD